MSPLHPHGAGVLCQSGVAKTASGLLIDEPTSFAKPRPKRGFIFLYRVQSSMRILVHSDLPEANSGYASQVSQLCVRLLEDGHELGWKPPFDADLDTYWGCPVFASPDKEVFGWESMAQAYQEFDADVVFSLSDHWRTVEQIQRFLDMGHNAIFYTVIDSANNLGRPSRKLKVLCHENAEVVTMSLWARELFQKFEGVGDVEYIPHCVDTSIYSPGDSVRDGLGCSEDDFLVSFVGSNQIRKNVTTLLDGFDRFQARDDVGDDVHFYFHTDPVNPDGFNLQEISEGMQFETGKVHTPDPGVDRTQVYDEEFLRNLYRASDVYLHATGGESWGMTITEALSCNTPVIATNYTSMTEQVADDHTVVLDDDEPYRHVAYGTLVNRGCPMWRSWKGTKFHMSHPDYIADALYDYYVGEGGGTYDETPRQSVLRRYDADLVYTRHWEPFFENLDI